MAKVIQKSSKSLISDAKDTCTQGIYMPAVFTSLLVGMLPQAHWVCLYSHTLLPPNRLGVRDTARGSPRWAEGSLCL